MLCQPNKVVFKVKMLSLYRLFPYRKPRRAEVGEAYHMFNDKFGTQ